MGSEPKVIHLEQHESRAQGPARRTAAGMLPEIQALAERHLSTLLQSLFDSVDDTLFEMADKAENNRIQALYFDAMRVIRICRGDIERNFRCAMRTHFGSASKPGNQSYPSRITESGEDELSLVGDAELEEDLAIRNMVTKSQARYQPSLHGLSNRIACVVGVKTEQLLNPLDPRQIVYAFRDAARALDVDVEVRLIVYKMFDKYVMSAMTPCYDECNALLISAGVLPQLRMVVRSTAAGSGPRARGAAGGTQGTAETGQWGAPPTNAGGATAGRGGYPGFVDGGLAVSPQLFAALTHLQQITLTHQKSGEAHPGGAGLRAVVTAQGVPIAPGEDNTIDVVSMLFDFILDDAAVPVAIKALIARLQIPVLKVALLDKTFFSKKSHPARRLLNEMARAGLGWDPQSDRGDQLYDRLEAIVDRILNEFDRDVGLFARMLQDLMKFLDQEERYFGVVEQRTRQAMEGMEKLEQAKAEVEQEIQKRLARGDIPAIVRNLLGGPWKSVLLLIHLRAGRDSETWNGAIELVDQLIHSVQPDLGTGERAQLQQAMPELMERLKTGLARISYQAGDLDRLIQDLKQCHAACFSDRAPAAPADAQDLPAEPAAPAQDEVVAPPETIVPTEPAPELERLELAEHLQRVEALHIGHWMEFRADGETPWRAKLSWKGRRTRRLIFVNRKGLKVAELTTVELAERLAAGTVVTIDDSPLIEKALAVAIQGMQRTVASREPEPTV